MDQADEGDLRLLNLRLQILDHEFLKSKHVQVLGLESFSLSLNCSFGLLCILFLKAENAACLVQPSQLSLKPLQRSSNLTLPFNINAYDCVCLCVRERTRETERGWLPWIFLFFFFKAVSECPSNDRLKHPDTVTPNRAVT